MLNIYYSLLGYEPVKCVNESTFTFDAKLTDLDECYKFALKENIENFGVNKDGVCGLLKSKVSVDGIRSRSCNEDQTAVMLYTVTKGDIQINY